MAAALVENLQREDLNPIDEGEGYRRLIEEFSLTQERVADSVGKSRSHIANTMRLLKLPSAVQTELRRGTLSAGHARALLTHPDPARAALAVIAQGLNVRQTEALTSRQNDADADGPTRSAASRGRKTPTPRRSNANSRRSSALPSRSMRAAAAACCSSAIRVTTSWRA